MSIPVSPGEADLASALRRWRSLLGEANALDGVQAQVRYGADTTAAERCLAGALIVSDRAQVPELVRIAAAHGISLWPVSTGRNWGYGTALPARDGCVLVDLSRLCAIVHFDAELGVVTVEPGVTQGMLADFLAHGGHPFMVPTTGAGPACSLIGNALERGYGITPCSDHWAAVTDLEAVLADGSSYRTAMCEAGGEDLARLHRWGIGPHTVGLFSQGGFGIVTRMSILLARRPECIKVCLFSLRDDALLEKAVEAVRGVLARLPGIVGGLNLMNRHRVLAMAAPWPRDRLGADGLIPDDVLQTLGREYQVLPWTGFATLYGTRRVVAAAQREIRHALRGVASRLVFLSQSSAGLLRRAAQLVPGSAGVRLGKTAATVASALELAEGRPNETALPLAYWRNPNPRPESGLDPARDGCGLIWFAPLVPMRPPTVRTWVDLATCTMRAHGIEPLITLTSVNERLFDSTLPLLFDRSDPTAVRAAHACHDALLAGVREIGGYPYRVAAHANAAIGAATPDAVAFQERLLDGLDPARLIAPGRYR